MSKYNYFQVSGVTHKNKMDPILFSLLESFNRVTAFQVIPLPLYLTEVSKSQRQFAIPQNIGTIKTVTTLSWAYILLSFSDIPTC